MNINGAAVDLNPFWNLILILMIASGVVYWLNKRSGNPNAGKDYHIDLGRVLERGIDIVMGGAACAFVLVIGAWGATSGDDTLKVITVVGAGMTISMLSVTNRAFPLSMSLPVTVAAAGSVGIAGTLGGVPLHVQFLALFSNMYIPIGILAGSMFAQSIIESVVSAFYILDEKPRETRWVHPWLRPAYLKLAAFAARMDEAEKRRQEQRRAYFVAHPNARARIYFSACFLMILLAAIPSAMIAGPEWGLGFSAILMLIALSVWQLDKYGLKVSQKRQAAESQPEAAP